MRRAVKERNRITSTDINGHIRIQIHVDTGPGFSTLIHPPNTIYVTPHSLRPIHHPFHFFYIHIFIYLVINTFVVFISRIKIHIRTHERIYTAPYFHASIHTMWYLHPHTSLHRFIEPSLHAFKSIYQGTHTPIPTYPYRHTPILILVQESTHTYTYTHTGIYPDISRSKCRYI